ncbi:MAG: hypothetical protein DHS20C18_43650 [Saprospiraceae bacterium]|nr:MAG: hypothetical protein DHS20C18_43650 [Saprospiraceae bacterium]
MKKIISILAFTFIFTNLSFAQVDTAYQEVLTKMFEVSGTEGAYKGAITQMFIMYKDLYPTVSAEIWTEFEKEFLNTSLTDLVEMLVPVYIKYMTKEDLEEVIAFYQTPVGKKFAKSTPMITQESMQVGQQWGTKIGQEFQQKMKEKGY